ncbi:MAG: hypothetical protein SPL52_01555 [Fibrobacter sp.]|jgi:hypothetical protein|nr:hypothetical protein [Fibrobacter sp.]
MNKKIYGLMAMGVATGFWACGSGDIMTVSGDDVYVSMVAEDTITIDGTVNSEPAKLKQRCPQCFEGSAPSSSSVTPPPTPNYSSSSRPANQSSSSERVVKSSSSGASSSSYTYPQNSSSSNGGGASSSSKTPTGDDRIGSCAPEQAIYEKDAAEKGVKWKFTRDPSVAATSLLSASFKWTTADGTPSTASATGTGGLYHTAKYTTSGVHNASLTVSMGAANYTIQCSPVQVNGEPITGCKCTTEATSIDYTATPTATWSVTGCTTGAGLNLAYQWDGAPGEASYSPTFTAAAASYAPVLKVANDDNTVVDVTCPAIKITEGPEYIIKETQGAGAIKLPAGSTIVSLEVDAYNNTVFCQVARADTPSGALNGTVNKVAIEGSDYIAVSMPAGSLKKGTTLEFVLDGPATCGVQ